MVKSGDRGGSRVVPLSQGGLDLPCAGHGQQ